MSDVHRCDYDDCTAAAPEAPVDWDGEVAVRLCARHAQEWAAWRADFDRWNHGLQVAIGAAIDAYTRANPGPDRPVLRGER